MTPALPAGRPDDWLPPGTAHPTVTKSGPPTGPPADWAPPSPRDWRPHHLAPPAPPAPVATGGSAGGPLIGLVVVLGVAVIAAAGVVSTRSADDASASRNPAPGEVATPTVSPLLAGGADEPTPPPGSAMGSTDHATGRWLLPEWRWDVLPTLAAGQEEAWQTLQAEPLAAITPPSPTGCDAPQIVADDAAYRNAVKRQWRCVHEAWTPIFETLGWSTVEPAVKFFSGAGTSSACGFATAPAFYCPAGDGVAFFGGDDRDLAMFWDLTINESVHHEYAHHVQNLAGMMDAVEEVTPTDDLDRRLELQATCLSASMTFRNEAVGFDQERWDDWQYSLNESVLDDDHGSRESLLYWGTRGLYAATVGDCNTWSVEPNRVD